MEETEKVSKMRLETTESCLEKISNECKEMKASRTSCFKMVCSRRIFKKIKLLFYMPHDVSAK